MRVKPILNLALGLFVVAAVVLIGWQSMSGRSPLAISAPGSAREDPSASATASDPERSATATAVPTQAVTEPVVGTLAVETPAPPIEPAAAAVLEKPATKKVVATDPKILTPAHKIVAMYFHGDVRCYTCRKVEAYAKEAVEIGFGEQVAAGVVEFRPVNVEREENRHFIQDRYGVNVAVEVWSVIIITITGRPVGIIRKLAKRRSR